MSDVLEQGATRWARPEDYGGGPTGAPNYDNKRTVREKRKARPAKPSKNPRRDRKEERRRSKVPKTPKTPETPKAPMPKPGSPIPAGRFAGLGRAARAGGLAGLIVGGVDGLEQWIYPPVPLYPNPKNGWTQTWRCRYPETPPNTGGPKIYRQNSCLGGQSGTSLVPRSFLQPTGTGYGHWQTDQYPDNAHPRYRHRQSWERKPADAAKPQVEPALMPGRPMPAPGNPNPWRHQPTVKPDPSPDPRAETKPDPRLDRPRGREISVGHPDPVRPTKPVRPVEPGPRKPPGRNERHGKTLSRSARIGLMFFAALDDVSEAAEVVDAMYEALPDKVKKRWDCDGYMPGRHPLIDTAGQYGLDRADCKSKALWHNFHSMDIQTAVENIIKNHLSDKLVGAMHRVLPNNVGSAMEEGEIALNKLISEFLDELVDLKPANWKSQWK